MGFFKPHFEPAAKRVDIPEVTTQEECRALLQREFAVIFKHSEACDLSQDAYSAISEFLAEEPTAEIYMISVLDSRPLSNLVEEHTGVRHESPQVLVLRGGKVVAHKSHRSITHSFLTNLYSQVRQAH